MKSVNNLIVRESAQIDTVYKDDYHNNNGNVAKNIYFCEICYIFKHILSIGKEYKTLILVRVV